MSTKLNDMKAQLAALTEERDRLDQAIEEMIADMAEVPADQRTTGDWAPKGAQTVKYLELTNRQSEVETEIVDLSRAINAADAPAEAPKPDTTKH